MSDRIKTEGIVGCTDGLADYGPYHDYPNEPIGGGNPYYRCCSCGASDPQINGTLSGHFSGCKWVQKKKRELSADDVAQRHGEEKL
jgi:hypothetical protein